MSHERCGHFGSISALGNGSPGQRMTAMLPQFVNAEIFEELPIYAAALLLGLVSGVLAVRLLTAGLGRLWLWVLIGGATLAALLTSLIAAKPEDWTATTEFWALAAAGMATVDLAVICLLDPWRTIPPSADRHIRPITALLPPGCPKPPPRCTPPSARVSILVR